MAWRRERPPRTGAARETPARPGAAAPPGELEAFCRGLYPILLEGDAAAFRRYLARWEDVVGDTAELAEAPLEQQREAMAALLRHPQRFNLPPWPIRRGPERDDERWTAAASPPAPEREAADASRSPAHGHENGAAVAVRAAPPPAAHGEPEAQQRPQAAGVPAAEGGASAAPAGFYQVDMLTGEFVPVRATAERPHHGYEVSPPAGDEPRPGRAPRRKRPRRSPIELVQLVLWPETEPRA